MQNKAAVLAVGSELLSGQVTNRNAAWFSSQLFELGIDTTRHLTVDDVESEIVEGIESLTRDAGLLIVTGGLGPTSDDLTRNAVATWCGEELAYDEGSWQHIVQLFSRFQSRSVPETNKQQCYFPRSARVLQNNAGTANGFSLRAKGRELFVFPGPPREIEQLWKDHVHAELVGRIPQDQRKRLRMWRTIGKGESALSEMVAPLVKGIGVDVAYRFHLPYVELKLRFPEKDAAKHAELCAKLDMELSPWLYEMDRQDVPSELVRSLLKYSGVSLYDGATQGNVGELLMPMVRDLLQRPAPISVLTAWENTEDPKSFVEQSLALDTESDVALAIAGFDASGNWAVGARVQERQVIRMRPSVYKGETMRARNMKAIAYLAAKAWLDALAGDLH